MKYFIYLCLACSSFGINTVSAKEKVTLQLKWHHQFQFAGYYVAKELGYYSDLGLDVVLRTVSNDQNPVDYVLKGGAEYGIGASDLVVLRAQGNPVVALGAIFQHSPYILLALQKDGIQSIADLEGRRVMIDPHAAEIVAYLKYLGLYPNKIKSISSNDYYPSDLVDGKIDAYAGYITNDPYYLEQRHIPYLAFTPQSEGIDFYGDTLYTLQKEIDDHPERASAFLHASLKGWNYAIDHPEATVDLMIERGYVKASEREKLLFEAKGTQKLVASNLISIGYMNPTRWQYIADIYAGLGMVPKNISLKGFLYSDEKPKDHRLLWILGILSFLGVIASLFSTHLYSLNRCLKLSYQLKRANNLSKLRKQAKDLRNLQYIDDLTGLPNLKMFKSWVNSLLNKSEKAGIYALLYLDFDNFKAVNNSHSHKIGDAILLEMVGRIQSELRQSSRLFHAGTDKFIILLTVLGDDRDLAVYRLNKFTNKIIHSIRAPCLIENVKHYLTASIGIMVCPPYAENGDTLLKKAEMAMFEAKRQGGNKIVFFDPQLQASLEESSQLESQLRCAIAQHQFQLHYQIQVDHLGRPFGAEALIRWIHPERNMILPLQFIPLAEETGLILPIGQWVLETACAQLAVWRQNLHYQDLLMSVNVSAKQFHQANFVTQVQETMQNHGIDPSKLKLELTESMLVMDIDDITKKMNALSQMGVRFSLDDFGTGFSSLQYLKKLPLSQLKIDQAFVRDIVTDKSDQAIIRTISAIAHSLDINVIAEGVQTNEQRKHLLDNGCTHFQGYLFGKPLPIKAFEALLIKSRLQVEGRLRDFPAIHS